MILPSKQDRDSVRQYLARPDPSVSSHITHLTSRARDPDACGTLWASFMSLVIGMIVPLIDAADELEQRRSQTDDKLRDELARLQLENDKLRCLATGGCVWRAACNCHDSGYMTAANGRCPRCGSFSNENCIRQDDMLTAMTAMRAEVAQLRASLDDLQNRHHSEMQEAACEERAVCEHILKVFRANAIKHDVENECKEAVIRTWDKAIQVIRP